MKKWKIRFLALFISLCLTAALFPVTALAAETSGECGERTTWEYKDGTLTISGFGAVDKFSSWDYDDSPWWEWSDEIEHIVIRAGVTYLSSYLFYNLYNVTDITITGELKGVGKHVFPVNGVETIGATTSTIRTAFVRDNAFYVVGGSREKDDESDGKIHLVYYPPERKDEEFTVFEKTAVIDDSVFEYNRYLKTVHLPDGLKTIGFGTFHGCSALQSLDIPDTVERIEGYAFRNCTALTELKMPANLTWIDLSALFGCDAIPKFTFPASLQTIYEAVQPRDSLDYDETGTRYKEFYFEGNAPKIEGDSMWFEVDDWITDPHFYYRANTSGWEQLKKELPFITYKVWEPAPEPSITGFSDVPAGIWYEDAVKYAKDRGLMTGVSADRFDPNGTTTRGQLMTILARLDGVDTSGNPWYQAGLDWSVSKGISDGTAPASPLMREQLVTMLWRYVNEPEAHFDLSGFADADRVSSWAREAMMWAVSNGIITGSGNNLKPGATASRCEMAAILMRFCQNVDIPEGSDVPVG